MGDAEELRRRMDHYKRLSPLDPYAFFLDGGFILAPLLQRDHEAAAIRDAR